MSTIRLFFVKQLLRRIKNRADYTNIQLARRGFEKIVGRFNHPLPGFTYTPTTIADMKCEWVLPDGADASKVLLYFHGGGYATGSINTHRAFVSQIARNAGIKALIIEYRLAPEHPYPAAIDDAVSAYKWLLENGYTHEQVAFGGDSAGGGITICSLLYLRDNHIPLPQCAFALSPWLDHTMGGNSFQANKDIDPMLIAEGFHLWSKFYLGEADPKSTYASPIFHDVSGLPPLYIQVGEEEMLLDDSTRFAEKAKAEGVEIKLDIYPKMFHVFGTFWRVLPESREANKRLGVFLKKHSKESVLA